MASATKVFSYLLLVVLLSNAMVPAANGQDLPIACFIECGVKLITCVVGCVENFICLFGCGTTEVKCAASCLDGNAAQVPPGNEEVTGLLETAGIKMKTVKAVAIISSSLSSSGKNSVKGSLQFLQSSTGEKTHVKGKIAGLTPGLHELHIHFIGSCSSIDVLPFNPQNMEHGIQSAHTDRVWRLGNVVANQDGIALAELSFEEKDIPLNGPHSILNRAVVVDADTRIGCGMIELK